jgi:hypothetical protein
LKPASADPDHEMQQPTADSFFSQATQWVLSAIGGALVMLVAFRTKLALMDRRIEARKTALEQFERKIEERLGGIDRRQTLILQIVADIARKIGVDSRFSDAVVQFLSDEADRARPRDREREIADSRDDLRTP